MKRVGKVLLAVLLMMTLVTACGKQEQKKVSKGAVVTSEEGGSMVSGLKEHASSVGEAVQGMVQSTKEEQQEEAEAKKKEEEAAASKAASDQQSASDKNATTSAGDASTNTGSSSNGKIVCIDAGHQTQVDYGEEALGPGSSEMKMKTSGGTSGVSTGIPEYQLTLTVSLQLQTELANRGYQVAMTRTTNDVDLGNIDRAQVANDAGADICVRVHANGSDNSGASGALTMCMTPSNPYNANLYDQSRALSEDILASVCSATGANNAGIIETDTMTGINWCQMPVTIVEMGFMTNPTEDQLLNSADYQAKMVQGIANGIDAYFN